MIPVMAEVRFLPFYARLLEQTVRTAVAEGAVDIDVRPDVDATVVAGQVRRVAADQGLRVACDAQGDRVLVRVTSSRSRRRAG